MDISKIAERLNQLGIAADAGTAEHAAEIIEAYVVSECGEIPKELEPFLPDMACYQIIADSKAEGEVSSVKEGDSSITYSGSGGQTEALKKGFSLMARYRRLAW